VAVIDNKTHFFELFFGCKLFFPYLCSRYHAVLSEKGCEGVGKHIELASYNAVFLDS